MSSGEFLPERSVDHGEPAAVDPLLTSAVAAPADDGVDPSPASPTTLATSAVKGFAWQVASFGGNRLVVFVSTLVLARLLDPRDFGVFAAALTFTQYLEVLLDFGLGSYLVFRQEEGVTEQLHIAFTYNLIVTLVLSAVVVGLSPLTARMFGAPHQVVVFAAMSGYLLLRGISQVNEAVVQRDLLFKKMVLIDLSGAVTRAGLSVGLALAGVGVWSIVAGFLAGQAVSTVAAWMVIRFRPHLRLDWEVGRAMVRFGINSVAIDLLTELSLNADYLVVGSMIGATALGFYTIAYRIPDLLINNLFWMFSTVAFPIYSRSRLAGIDSLRRAMLKALRLTTVYGFTAGVGLALVARDAVGVLFGGQWHTAAGPMVLISVAAALASAAYASGPLFPAIGKPGTLVLVNIPLTIVRVTAFVLAARYGILWVAAVHLATNAVMIFVRLGIANKVTAATVRQTWDALQPGLSATAGLLVLALPLRLILPEGPVSLISIVGAGLVGAVLGVLITSRSLLKEILGLAHRLLDSSAAVS